MSQVPLWMKKHIHRKSQSFADVFKILKAALFYTLHCGNAQNMEKWV